MTSSSSFVGGSHCSGARVARSGLGPGPFRGANLAGRRRARSASVAVALAIALLGCGGAGADAPSGVDAAVAVGCHDNGEPFALPADDLDPWQVYQDGRIGEYCCDPTAARIVASETMADGACTPTDPPLVVCVPEPTDLVCDAGEDFCTSAIDCPPPDASYPLCCGVGDACQGLGPSFSTTGASGCCAGLEMIEFAVWSNRLGECVGVPFPDAGICVLDCGDGACTAGENRCNCPDDCAG